MSSTTTTQYYGLTQYIGTDKPDFADNNTAFRNVDADLHQVVQDSQGFTSDIADLTERVGNLNTDLTNLSGDLDGEKAKITALQNKELSQDTEIARVERNAQDMITAYNEASATSTHAYAVGDYFIYNNVLYQATAAIAVGATIVPDTNCTTTNVASELIQLNNDLPKLLADVVADGVKTTAVLLGEVNTALSGKTVKPNGYMDFGGTITKYDGNLQFSRIASGAGLLIVLAIKVASSGSAVEWTFTTSSNTATDYSTQVQPAGTHIKVFG